MKSKVWNIFQPKDQCSLYSIMVPCRSISTTCSQRSGSIVIDVYVSWPISLFSRFLVSHHQPSDRSHSVCFSSGLSSLLEALEIEPATSSTCRAMLERGDVLAISPGTDKGREFVRLNDHSISGGVREALFSDHHYQLIWKERKGFARVAIEAKTVRPISLKFYYRQRDAFDSCRQ